MAWKNTHEWDMAKRKAKKAAKAKKELLAPEENLWMWSKPATKRYKRKKPTLMSVKRLQRKVGARLVKLAHKVALTELGPLPRHAHKSRKAKLTKKQRRYGLAAKGTLS